MDDELADQDAIAKLPFSAAELSALRAVVSFLEAELPESYRALAFRRMLDRVLGSAAPARSPGGMARPAASGRQPAEGEAAPAGPVALDPYAADLEPYRELFESGGRTLAKALAALEIGARQLGTPWMNPAEIEAFLREVAGVTTAYRSNISNALAEARPATQRRRRGRGYEYRLTDRGARLVRRAVHGARLR